MNNEEYIELLERAIKEADEAVGLGEGVGLFYFMRGWECFEDTIELIEQLCEEEVENGKRK